MQQVVLASNNAGKIREFNQLLNPFDLNVVPKKSLGIGSVEETGLTFVENALIKARHASRLSGLPALADDSGLEVDALNGAPGIRSARYAGPEASDGDNNTALLKALAGIPADQRSARYHCVLVFLRHAEDPVPLICHASWEGVILEAPRGEGGFGYDPLFWLPERGCSAAELSAEEKNRLSHRGRAMQALLAAMQARLG